MDVKIYTKTTFGEVVKGGVFTDTSYCDFDLAVNSFRRNKAIGISVCETDIYLSGKKVPKPRKIFLFGPWEVVSKEEALILNEKEKLGYIGLAKMKVNAFFYSEAFKCLMIKDNRIFPLE